MGRDTHHTPDLVTPGGKSSLHAAICGPVAPCSQLEAIEDFTIVVPENVGAKAYGNFLAFEELNLPKLLCVGSSVVPGDPHQCRLFATCRWPPPSDHRDQ